MSGTLLEVLAKHLHSNYVSFHTPGHKGKGKLEGLAGLLAEFGLKLDLTELPGLDNLQLPMGPILEGEEEAARLMGARKTFFLVNGATGGILAGALAATKPGDRVLLPRNCHRAFWSAMVLGDLQPVFVVPDVYRPAQVILPPTFKNYLTAFSNDGKVQNITMLVGVNPTYEGLSATDLGQVISWAHSQQMVTLIDEAHGSLFPLHEELPFSAIQLGGDLIVHGTHKTMGSLTQSGLLHLGTDKVAAAKVRQALQIVHTSSPSYLLLASLVEATQGDGVKEMTDNLLELAATARKQIAHIRGIQLVDEEIITKYSHFQGDKTRLVLSAIELGLTGNQLAEFLRNKYRIQVEMELERYVVLLLGLGTRSQDIEHLVEALKDISSSLDVRLSNRERSALSEGDCNSLIGYFAGKAAAGSAPELAATPRESFYASTYEVLLEEARGEVAGEMICPYPPGIPVLYPGELISAEIIQLLKATTGIHKIKVLC